MAETRILLARSPHGFLAQVGDPDTLIPGDSIRDAHWPADG
jgi:hypothetical protein